MEGLLEAFLGILGIVLLYYGAEFLIKGGVSIANRLKISPLVIGLTLVAFGTSAPELVVSINAALSGSGDISMGNVVGSNICNIALILGLSALISTLNVNGKLLKFDVPVMILSAIALVGFYYMNKGVERWEGLILFVALLAYTIWSFYDGRKAGSAVANTDESLKVSLPIWLSLIFVVGGLAGLIFGAKFFVSCAIYLARLLHVSEATIGLTVVAVGTSLPELATSVVAALKGEKDIAVGNVVGSNIFNILCILGIAPLIAPIHAPGISVVDMGLMIAISILLYVMMFTGRLVSRLEGAILLAGYVAYTGWLIYQA